jgi:NAD(P)-dependent dehydrogenase (short-subunit alcohol dehydrogenase family)
MADWIRQDEEALQRWASTIPARRIGEAREIADGVAYLASDSASYVQGAVLMADGGVTA